MANARTKSTTGRRETRTKSAERAEGKSAKRKTAKAVTAKTRASVARPVKRRAAARSSVRPTLATISAKIDSLAEQIERLGALVETIRVPERASPPLSARVDGEVAVEEAGFDDEIAAVVAELDRSARHAGLVPIPEVRSVFLGRGWSRRAFDERLLQAERDFVVDLKTANDPSRLVDPGLAIEQPGRGYLQYVVAR